MSVNAMGRVWASAKAKGSRLVILLAIADFANDQGEAWPSIRTLARKARISERQTQLIIKELIDSGELQVLRNAGPYQCNLFRLTFSGGEATNGVKSSHPGEAYNTGEGGNTGVIDNVKGVKPITPKPSKNRQGTTGPFVPISSIEEIDTSGPVPAPEKNPEKSSTRKEKPISPIKTIVTRSFLDQLSEDYPETINGKSLDDIIQEALGRKNYEKTNDKQGYLIRWITREVKWQRDGGSDAANRSGGNRQTMGKNLRSGRGTPTDQTGERTVEEWNALYESVEQKRKAAAHNPDTGGEGQTRLSLSH